MKKIKAFMCGVREFRLTYTTSHATLDERDAYDRGREMAHKLTGRRYET